MDTFDSIHWHQVIGRVHRGQASQRDRHNITCCLRLPQLSRLIEINGGDPDTARYLQTNLGFIRRRSLAGFGFREVRS